MASRHFAPLPLLLALALLYVDDKAFEPSAILDASKIGTDFEQELAREDSFGV